jgi:Cupin superfamily protein
MPMESLIDLANAALNPDAAAVPQVMHRGELMPPFRHITLERVEQLVAGGNLQPPLLSLVRDGSSVPAAECLLTTRYPYPSSPPTATLDFARVVRAFREGHTLKLIGCDRFIPELASATNSLRKYLGHPVLGVMFIAPPGGNGFGIHADSLDTFVFQLAGIKEWEVFDRLPGRIPFGLIDRAETGGPRFTATLEPGDVLFLPRGCPHAAKATTLSMHISIGARTITVRELLAMLLRSSSLPSEVEQTIPFAAWPPQKPREVLEAGIEAFISYLESLPWNVALAQAAGPELPSWEPGTLWDVATPASRSF